MRSLVATITAVALLASAPLANAADSVTTPVPGWCSATPEVALFDLTDHVSDAQCKSDASVRVDPRLVAMVTEKLVYVGPREMGKPSGKEREIVFAWLPTPITDPDNPGQVVFAMNQYQSYRDLKAANGRWMNTVSAVGEKVGEHAAERIFLIGPKWMKSGIAAGVKTGVDLAGAVAFQAPFAMMAPYTAGVSLMPSTAMYAEALFMAPTGTAHGASELVDGVKARNFEQALEGGAEFCGNVGIVLLAAAPAMEGGNALVPRAKPPLSMLEKSVAPASESIGSAAGKSAPIAKAPVPKFADYVFKEGATHGKDLIFRKLGYGKEDSVRLAAIWEQQAADKFSAGEFSLGKLDQYGQRIDIEIALQGQGSGAGKTSYIRSGWMIEADGTIKLTTPFSGFTR